ncbi:MAG: YicC family protein [Treponema sp.]|nr:YicC family protein [Treponema sp.]
MNSMTGYGFKEAVIDTTQISVEIKSVNNRFLDLNVFLPSFLSPLEPKVREIVSGKVQRGKIDVSIRVKDLSTTAHVSADLKAVEMYKTALTGIAEKMGLSAEAVTLPLVASQDGVLVVTHEYDADSYWEKIKGVFDEVLDVFLRDRKREGENLKKDLLLKLDVLDDCAAFFKKSQPLMEEKFRENITAKFKEIVGSYADENRILNEVAAMMVKFTINEEIVRLFSHLESLRAEITQNETPGKRLDFICQEANREINTIGSKNQSVEIGKMVINAKDALENIREQAKNVE